jgi:hypothetical protein
MYCQEHPKYMGKRMPRVPCLSCWRIYTENTNQAVEDVASRMEKTKPALASWLRQSIDDIIYAVIKESTTKSATATLETTATILNDEELSSYIASEEAASSGK